VSTRPIAASPSIAPPTRPRWRLIRIEDLLVLMPAAPLRYRRCRRRLNDT
jgi:hypothetical protein